MKSQLTKTIPAMNMRLALEGWKLETRRIRKIFKQYNHLFASQHLTHSISSNSISSYYMLHRCLKLLLFLTLKMYLFVRECAWPSSSEVTNLMRYECRMACSLCEILIREEWILLNSYSRPSPMTRIIRLIRPRSLKFVVILHIII